MANDEHVALLRQGVGVWNAWRDTPAGIAPDLSGADLAGLDLNHARLYWTKLGGANLRGTDLDAADLVRADLMGADASGARLREANLQGAFFASPNAGLEALTAANFTGADLTGAYLMKVDLTGVSFHLAILREAHLDGSTLAHVDLREADLRGADLSRTLCVGTQLQGADLRDCMVYGCAVWNVCLEGAKQTGLRVSHWNEPALFVDNLEVAQFIYLLLHNEKLRGVIDTITSKVVLILGAFASEHKRVLDALRTELARRDYAPIVFDFQQPQSRNTTETVFLLANLARFIIVDLTAQRSVPHELATIVPHLRSVAVQPLIQKGERPYGMFQDFQGLRWVLKPYEYEDEAMLLRTLKERVLDPVERRSQSLRRRGRARS